MGIHKSNNSGYNYVLKYFNIERKILSLQALLGIFNVVLKINQKYIFLDLFL
jgi:hypothetical protein